MGAYQFQNPRVDYYFETFLTKEIYEEHPELVVISSILPDPLNTYLTEFTQGIVDKINDEPMKTLKDVAAAFAKPAEFYVVKFIGAGRPLVLERATVEAARERIVKRYNVIEEQNLGDDK
jgi:hypothetical protein